MPVHSCPPPDAVALRLPFDKARELNAFALKVAKLFIGVSLLCAAPSSISQSLLFPDMSFPNPNV